MNCFSILVTRTYLICASNLLGIWRRIWRTAFSLNCQCIFRKLYTDFLQFSFVELHVQETKSSWFLKIKDKSQSKHLKLQRIVLKWRKKSRHNDALLYVINTAMKIPLCRNKNFFYLGHYLQRFSHLKKKVVVWCFRDINIRCVCGDKPVSWVVEINGVKLIFDRRPTVRDVANNITMITVFVWISKQNTIAIEPYIVIYILTV